MNCIKTYEDDNDGDGDDGDNGDEQWRGKKDEDDFLSWVIIKWWQSLIMILKIIYKLIN